jgi:hypothetical protein
MNLFSSYHNFTYSFVLVRNFYNFQRNKYVSGKEKKKNAAYNIHVKIKVERQEYA